MNLCENGLIVDYYVCCYITRRIKSFCYSDLFISESLLLVVVIYRLLFGLLLKRMQNIIFVGVFMQKMCGRERGKNKKMSGFENPRF